MSHDYEQYYFAKELAGNVGLGELWFLKSPIRIGTDSNGGKFLGSLVEYINNWYTKEYPVPKLYAPKDQVIIEILKSLTKENPVTVSRRKIPLTKLKNTSNFSSHMSTSIPGIPIKLNMKVDLSDVVAVEIAIEEPRLEYIKQGVLCLLGTHYKTTDEIRKMIEVHDLEKVRIVDEVLFASKYTVRFTSSSSFDGNFEASVDLTFSGVPVNIGGGVTASFAGEKSLILEVDLKQEYLLGLKTTPWSDMDFD
ncbi:MAG TPA: hypothetical protein DD381_00980 [Lentisphaeria bacterium]|nr:MAG: hypothetical protein A2X47_13840 [Lentisphaerae bacterium GWF2_38_69]HBM14916.1 hypothetical protein [Lentisphaeria bacterium]